MIILITGIPGAGKTLFAVSRLKKAIEDNMALPADGQRKIYCDITGLNIEGIEPPPIDWRQTPPKSLLIYDEAQLHPEFKPHRGVSPYKFVEELTIHRKTGHEIWYITQDPKRLHANILEMCEMHYHLERPYGAKLASIYEYKGHEKNPRSLAAKGRAENKRLFHYDKSLYDLYQSSQVEDGIKFRLPKEILLWVGILIAIIAYVYYNATSSGTSEYLNQEQQQTNPTALTPDSIANTATSTQGQEQPQQEQQLPQNTSDEAQNRRIYYYQKWLPADYEIIKQDENLQVRGVIKMGNDCKAYNTHGDLMTLNVKECQFYISQTGRVHKSASSLQAQSNPITPQNAPDEQKQPLSQNDDTMPDNVAPMPQNAPQEQIGQGVSSIANIQVGAV